MRKLVSILLAGTILVASCKGKNEGGLSEKAKKNIEACHTVMNAFISGDTSGIDAVVASDFVDHTDKGDMGRDSLKAMIVMMHKMVKDQKSEVVKDLADDDYVFSWVNYTGTSDGSLGMPAGPYKMGSIETVKFKDGKAVEHWSFMEARDMMKMMPPPPPPQTMDTTHK